MTSSFYFSDILNAAASRYSSIRNQLFADDKDGDTEDDSLICRVLRSYYVQQRMTRPEWLPPDPKTAAAEAAAAATAASAQEAADTSAAAAGKFGFVTSMWGRSSAGANVPSNSNSTQPYQQQNQQSFSSARGTGGLSDLWDSPAPTTQSNIGLPSVTSSSFPLSGSSSAQPPSTARERIQLANQNLHHQPGFSSNTNYNSNINNTQFDPDKDLLSPTSLRFQPQLSGKLVAPNSNNNNNNNNSINNSNSINSINNSKNNNNMPYYASGSSASSTSRLGSDLQQTPLSNSLSTTSFSTIMNSSNSNNTTSGQATTAQQRLKTRLYGGARSSANNNSSGGIGGGAAVGGAV